MFDKATSVLASNQILQATSGLMALLFLWGAFRSGSTVLKIAAGVLLALVVMGLVKARG
mgnify:FL=1